MAGDVFRLLLIQDHAADAKLTQMMLSRSTRGAFEVRSEDTVRGALAYLEREPVDLVLLDLALGDGSALTPLRRLQDRFPQIPVVVLVAYPERDLGALALDAGAQDYLIKGQVSAEILSRVLPYSIQIARLRQMYQNCTAALECAVAERTADLRTRCEQTESVIENMPAGVVITDAMGQIQHMNRTAEAYLSRFPAPDQRAALEAAIQDAAVSSGGHAGQVFALGGVDLLLRAAPVDRLAKGADLIVVTLQDIAYPGAADPARTHFASDAARELRTPLTTLKSFLDLIRRRPQQAEHYWSLVDQELDREIGLMERIIELSDLDAGRLVLSTRLTNLNLLCDDSVSRYEGRAQQRGIQTLLHASSSPALALVDPERMALVLDNLLRNAFQYTPAGGLVMVSLDHELVDGRPWVTLSVADSGIGIPDHELPRIFERFFRGEQARTPATRGAGLGLALVDELVRLHGGWVRVDSRVGRGSTFTLWIPAPDTPATARPTNGQVEVRRP